MSYLREVEEMLPTLSSRQRLTLLRHFLDAATAETLEAELEQNSDLQYDRYWARLDLSFGGDDKEALRRQLRQHKLSTRGKLTEKDWREFAVRAQTLAAQIGDVSPVELGRHMTDALPPQPWRRKLAEEAEKRSHQGTLSVEGLPMDVTAMEMAQMVLAETGQAVAAVRRDGSRFKVTPSSEAHREAIK